MLLDVAASEVSINELSDSSLHSVVSCREADLSNILSIDTHVSSSIAQHTICMSSQLDHTIYMSSSSSHIFNSNINVCHSVSESFYCDSPLPKGDDDPHLHNFTYVDPTILSWSQLVSPSAWAGVGRPAESFVCVPRLSHVVDEHSGSLEGGLTVGPKEESCVAVTEHWEHVIDSAIPVIMTHDTGKRPVIRDPLPARPQLPGPAALSADEALPRPLVAPVFKGKASRMAGIYGKVRRSGIPNYRGVRVRVPSTLNISAWCKLEPVISDASLVDCLAFGFPIGFQEAVIPCTDAPNHPSACSNPSHVTQYLHTELDHGAMLGPFVSPPFLHWFRTNPTMTRPKRDSDNLRVILDLSYPLGRSVNSSIPVEALDGAQFKLRLPAPSALAASIRSLGPGCDMFKVDLSRAYRQLRSDRLDWPFFGIHWQDEFFLDVAVPFGLRHGASACQRTTEAVVKVASHRHGTKAHPYIDDTSAAALPAVSSWQYQGLLNIMVELGLDAALAKCQPPSRRMIWVGVVYDSDNLTMAIDPERISEARWLCAEFLHRDFIMLREIQSLVGKIFHVSKCASPAHRFCSRLLDLLRAAQRTSPLPVTEQARLDARWFYSFLPLCNGMALIKSDTADLVVQVDACLASAGGVCATMGYYHFRFPQGIAQCGFCIAALEAFNILVACRLWAPVWKGQHVLLFSDSWVVVCAINSGAAFEPLIRAVMREIWLLAAVFDIELVVRHRPGASMVTADALSRASLSDAHAGRVARLVRDLCEPRCEVSHRFLAPPVLI